MFYGLYCSGALLERIKAPILDHFSEEIPGIKVDAISAAHEHLKNVRATRDDGVTTDLLEAAGRPFLKALAKVFNTVIHRGSTTDRHMAVVFFKRGDKMRLNLSRSFSSQRVMEHTMLGVSLKDRVRNEGSSR